MPITRTLVVCDCCGEAGLATVLSDVHRVQIEIRARRHGQWHTLILDMEALAHIDGNQVVSCSAAPESLHCAE